MKLSVVVPVYNEQGNCRKLHREILAVVRTITKNYEIIFVNDNSKDGTLEELKTLKPVVIVNLGRNTGQSAALKAGFDHATGDIIVSMDGDGQNDPRDIPRLLKELNKGYDVVSGWRKNRKDTAFKRLTSRFGVMLHHMIINDRVHDSGCTLKAYRAWTVRDLELHGEMHRYLPALLILRGARMGELVVNHRARTVGVSKYKATKIFKGLVDLFLMWFWQKYSARPVHLMGFLSLFVMAFGFVCGLLSLYLKYGPEAKDLSDTFLPNVAFFCLIIGIQLFMTGILADIMIRTYYKNTKPYAVREVIRK
jgi:glycosyltransferase involved in cell wall biosynthesis